MAKYNFFISYSRADGSDKKKAVAEKLREKKYTVWADDEIESGANWASEISSAIAGCDCFIPIITKGYNMSNFALNELQYVLRISESRSIKVIPLVFDREDMSTRLSFLLSSLQQFYVDDERDLISAIESIDGFLGYKLRSEFLYEKLSEYTKLKSDNKEAETVCELLELIYGQIQSRSAGDYSEIKKRCQEILRLYERLKKYVGSYDAESKNAARRIIEVTKKTEVLFESHDLFYLDDNYIRKVYFAAFAVRILYLQFDIHTECIDVLSNGDVHNAVSIESFSEKQRQYKQTLREFFKKESTEGFPKEDIAFIKETEKYYFFDSLQKNKQKSQRDIGSPALSEEDEILVSVANFMQEGNRLFDVLQSHGMAGDFLNCLLTSYERLKNYCEIVGAKKVAADCVERIVEIRHELDKQEAAGQKNEKVENGIKSLLGFTIRGSGDYDVFISFKSEDSDMAAKIYRYCQSYMKEPFWSKRTLPQLSKSEYEDAIFDAIRRSKHFVVVLSDLKYLAESWVKKEMSSFDRAITEGRKKDANFVFVVTDDVYRQIIDSKKMCLDERYCGYQIIKMSEYEENLIHYIT